MVVNSLNFLLFFIVVFTIYYLPIGRRSSKFQNTWILLSSYFFYGFADWKMIPLLLGITIVFYGLGNWLKYEMDKKETKKASHITTVGVFLGVGVLLYFKYLNFFADSFAQLFSTIGFNISWTTLNIVLPIGVSFFTFKLISYIIEIHREHIVPCKDFIEFGTYIAFFPTILSGPIDRPNKFIPQLRTSRSFDYNLAIDGSRQILWGMFTKMCIADNLALFTDSTWDSYHSHSGSTLLIAALLYLIQMYADFDGYSNMAIGVGKILGLRITKNFNHPFLARNIAEYWRRWHISLTSWITDYVFMPLNIKFRNYGNFGVISALIINLITIGLWHGANWTYAFFGLYHGLLYIPLVLSGSFGKNKKIKPTTHGLPKLEDFIKMIATFALVSAGLIFFRAENISDAFSYFCQLFSLTLLSIPAITPNINLYAAILLSCYLIITEWLYRTKEYPTQGDKEMSYKNYYINLKLSDFVIVLLIIIFGNIEGSHFIYFQF